MVDYIQEVLDDIFREVLNKVESRTFAINGKWQTKKKKKGQEM